MDNPSDRERLLNDVFAEPEPSSFRAALLNETLRHARRQRRLRKAKRASLLVAIASLLGFFGWQRSPWGFGRAPLKPSYQLVQTLPLPVTQLVSTQPFETERLVTSFASVATVTTGSEEIRVRLIGDRELLALAAPRSAALIRVSPTEQRLILLPTDDGPGAAN